MMNGMIFLVETFDGQSCHGWVTDETEARAICQRLQERDNGWEEQAWTVRPLQRAINSSDQLAAMRERERLLQEQLVEEIRRTTKWQDLYNREVHGLNNEGDAIGGEPAVGLKIRAEQAEQLLQQLRLLLNPPRDGGMAKCVGRGTWHLT